MTPEEQLSVLEAAKTKAEGLAGKVEATAKTVDTVQATVDEMNRLVANSVLSQEKTAGLLDGLLTRLDAIQTAKAASDKKSADAEANEMAKELSANAKYASSAEFTAHLKDAYEVHHASLRGDKDSYTAHKDFDTVKSAVAEDYKARQEFDKSLYTGSRDAYESAAGNFTSGKNRFNSVNNASKLSANEISQIQALYGMETASMFSPLQIAPEFSSERIFRGLMKCADDATDALSMIEIRTISGRKYFRDYISPNLEFAGIECEGLCLPTDEATFVIPEREKRNTKRISTVACMHTDTIEEQSDYNWEAEANRQMLERIRNTMVQQALFGTAFEGIIGNVTQYDVAAAALAGVTAPAAGQLNLQTVIAAEVLLSERVINPKIYGNRAGRAALATTMNAQGDKVNYISVNAGGKLTIGGYEYVVVNQLPNGGKAGTNQANEVGKVNYLIGDMREAYRIELRKNARVARYDQPNGSLCFTLVARAEADGYVKCSNALVAIKA